MSQTTITDEVTAVAGVASAITRHASSYGIDIQPICKALEIDPADFHSLTGRVSIDRVCRLLEACALLSNDEAFGLKAVSSFVPGATGAYGYGLMSAPTVRDFVQFLADHIYYVTQTSYCTLQHDEWGAALSWTFSPLIVKRDQYVDMTVALVCQRLRTIIGDYSELIELELERPKPRNLSIFREQLSRRLTFGNRINTIRFPQQILDLVNPKADEQLFRLMDIQCGALRPDDMQGAEFVVQVRRYIRLRIAEPSLLLSDIAPYFTMSERTFQRRLAEYNTTLNDLRDEERRDLSLKLLTESDLPVAEICYRLGYSAPSAFTRSVIRWFGVPPRALRQQKAI